MKIGIVRSYDPIPEIPIGGSSSVIKSILPYLDSDTWLFGIGIEEDGMPPAARLGEKIRFLPLFDVRHPSRVPLRLKSFLIFWLAKKRISRRGCDVLYIHSPERANCFPFGKRIAPVIFHQHGSSNPSERSGHRWLRIGAY